MSEELDRLPAHLRESLVLVYLEGHSRETAAELTNTTEQTIKSRLSRARNLLRHKLLKRGLTFTTAFTAFSLTTEKAHAAAVTAIPETLIQQTLSTVQTGHLPAPSVGLPLDSITLLTTGAPPMSMTTFYTTLAVATLLLLTTLGLTSTGQANNETSPHMSFSLREKVAESSRSDEGSLQHATTFTLAQSEAPAPGATAGSPSSDDVPLTFTLAQTPIPVPSPSEGEGARRADEGELTSSETATNPAETSPREGEAPPEPPSSSPPPPNEIKPLPNFEETILDLKLERAELNEKIAAKNLDDQKRLKAKGLNPNESVEQAQLKLLDARIEWTKVLKEKEDLRAKAAIEAAINPRAIAPSGTDIPVREPSPSATGSANALATAETMPPPNPATSLELQLIQLEIDTLKGSIESGKSFIKRGTEDPQFFQKVAPYAGVQTIEDYVKVHEQSIATSTERLAELERLRQALLSQTEPQSARKALAEIELRRIDYQIEASRDKYQQLLYKKLRDRGASLPEGNYTYDPNLDASQLDQLKFDLLELAVEEQLAEQKLRDLQPVGSAERTVNPPATTQSATGSANAPRGTDIPVRESSPQAINEPATSEDQPDPSSEPSAKASPDASTIPVLFQSNFPFTISFDNADLTNPVIKQYDLPNIVYKYSSEAPLAIPTGRHALHLTYQSSSGKSSFTVPLILEILPYPNQLDLMNANIAFAFELSHITNFNNQTLSLAAYVSESTEKDRIREDGTLGGKPRLQTYSPDISPDILRQDFATSGDGQFTQYLAALLYSPDFKNQPQKVIYTNVNKNGPFIYLPFGHVIKGDTVDVVGFMLNRDGTVNLESIRTVEQSVEITGRGLNWVRTGENRVNSTARWFNEYEQKVRILGVDPTAFTALALIPADLKKSNEDIQAALTNLFDNLSGTDTPVRAPLQPKVKQDKPQINTDDRR